MRREGKKRGKDPPRMNSVSRELMPAWRETGRDLIERIFAKDDVA